MLRIGICDDMAVERTLLKDLCVQILEGYEVEYTLYESGVSFFESTMEVDLLFLDIEMNPMDGIQIKERLEQMNRNIRIIFVTNHREVMPQAFGMFVCGFISKPLSTESVKSCLDKFLHLFVNADQKQQVTLKTTIGDIKVLFDDIVYIESVKHYLHVWMEDGSMQIMRANIADMEKELPKKIFFRCHKSYIVNLRYVKEIGKEIKLRAGSSILVSKMRKAELTKAYCKYVQRKVSATWIR